MSKTFKTKDGHFMAIVDKSFPVGNGMVHTPLPFFRLVLLTLT